MSNLAFSCSSRTYVTAWPVAAVTSAQTGQRKRSEEEVSSVQRLQEQETKR